MENEMNEIMNNTDKKLQTRNSAILIFTSFVWGISFVAQSEGGDAIGPLSFNSIRSIIGSLVLMVVIAILDKVGIITKKPESKEQRRTLLLGGVLCGVVLCTATNLQQLAISLGSPVGKAGFLTACYILLVPILGIFLKRKCGLNVWVGVVIAIVGLYLLCIDGEFVIKTPDILLMLCALCFSFHIMIIDHFSPKVDGLRMSCIQFMVTGVITAVPMFFVEMRGDIKGWLGGFASLDAWIPLLYAAIFSCAVGYTLQIIGQKGLNPTIASLLMSLESVFSVLAGWVLLKQKLTVKELLGCLLIFIAVCLAQLPGKKQDTKSSLKQS